MVVAIIGGTLLGLGLTRPRLAWLERLDDGSRRYGEIVMTVGAFVIGGYAYGSLYLSSIANSEEKSTNCCEAQV